MTGAFLARQTFAVRGRGRVIVGDVVDGTVAAGMHAKVPTPAGAISLRITGVEMVDDLATQTHRVGLWFDTSALPLPVDWDALARQQTRVEVG